MNDETIRVKRMEPPTEAQGERINEFLAQGGGKGPTHEFRQRLPYWKLSKNPAALGIAHGFVVGAGVEERLVSTLTVTPRRMWWRGEDVLWAEVGDTVTAPEFQRRGLFSGLHDTTTRSARNSGIEVMYGLPNQNAFPGWVYKFEWLVKENANLQLQTKIVGTSRAADAILSRLSDSAIARFVLGFLKLRMLDGLLRTLDRFWLRLQGAGETTIENVPEFSSDFDDLWLNVRDVLQLSTLRDRKYLHWRYIENPFPFKILAARLDGRLVGYIVTLFEFNEGSENGRLWIVDWLYDPSAGKSIGSHLLRRALLETQDGMVEAVTAISSRDTPFPLPWRRFGFFARQSPKPVILYPNEKGREVMLEEGSFHFTLSDTDPF